MKTVILRFGMSSETFLRLFSRAPRMMIESRDSRILAKAVEPSANAPRIAVHDVRPRSAHRAVCPVGGAGLGAGRLPDDGKRWRQVTETVGVTAARVAELCPRDGADALLGRLRGLDLGHGRAGRRAVRPLRAGDPDGRPAGVGGPQYLFAAATFLGDMRPRSRSPATRTRLESVARLDGVRQARAASATPTRSSTAGFGIGPAAGRVELRLRGAWLWRPITDDITKPVVVPTVSGTLGTQGWYTSDVTVSWSVSDPESAVRVRLPAGDAA